MRIDLEVPEEESRTRPGWEEQYRQYMAVGGGFAEVTPEHVTVLADSAEKPDEIDIKRAEAARQRAIKRVRSSDEDIDMERAELALRRALTRLRVAARYSRRRTR
jgi:F-type H+-transporting ATPase subunit epsilon